MSQFFDLASMVLVPSGYRDGKLYSQKPLSTDGELTFSRGSDIEATRVAANGYIEKAKVNLLLQSNSFNTTWFTNGSPTLTGGQADKDGGTDAWLLGNTGLQYASVRQTISNAGVVSLSVYAKAGTLDYLAMNTGGSLTAAWFDLANGTTGSIDTNVIDSAIESVGGGWHRCSMSIVGITEFRIYVTDADSNFGTATGNIYIQDAQLNYGLVAQEYQETTTTSVVSGITNDMPRLDYSGGASCPSLLLEGERQNLVTQSEFFGASDWTKNVSTITSNSLTSPEGVDNAALLTESTFTNDSASVYQSLTTTTNVAYTTSFFVKQGAGRYVYLRNYYAAGGHYYTIVVDTQEGTITKAEAGANVTSVDSDIENYGNGWYRVWARQTSTQTTLLTIIGISDIAEPTIGGFGQVTIASDDGRSAYFYGAQCELGTYPTSYIPTYGTSATRTDDECSKTGISSLIGQTEGTLFAEVDAETIGKMGANVTHRIMMASDGTNTNRILINFFENSSNVTQVEGILIKTTSQASFANTINENKKYKIAFAYKANDFTFYVNGVQIGTDTSGDTYTGTTLNRLDVGQDRTGTSQQSNPIAQVLLFPTRLSNADLATLTTL